MTGLPSFHNLLSQPHIRVASKASILTLASLQEQFLTPTQNTIPSATSCFSLPVALTNVTQTVGRLRDADVVLLQRGRFFSMYLPLGGVHLCVFKEFLIAK